MSTWLRRVSWLLLYTAGASAGEPVLNINNPALYWRAHRNPDTTCVLTGTAVSEMRNDAFEVQFRHARGDQLKLFVLIPKLPGGGTMFMEAPTTRDRWRIFTESYVPVLIGDKADSLRRNASAGLPLHFTFEFPPKRPVKYETVSNGSTIAAFEFNTCVDRNAQEALQAVKAVKK